MIAAENPLLFIARQRLLAGSEAALPDPKTLVRVVAEELCMPWVDLASRAIEADVASLLPRDLAQEQQILPFARTERCVDVAIADPLAVTTLDSLEGILGQPVTVWLADAEGLASAIARVYSTGLTHQPWANEIAVAEEPSEGEASADDAPVIRLVKDILADAVARRASDIHLEPLEHRFRVRYRIDGEMQEAETPPKRLQLPLISRLKIMANISIAEKRVPQDGRVRVEVSGRPLDFRVSTLPTVHGESIVMRVLDEEQLRVGLPELGLLADDQAVFSRLLGAADGMMLVTGPTGSGKTTTLYASLHQLNQPDRKIITVEEPVEYQIPGINQVPVNPATGMTFAAALRAMLRQAPNVAMIGEIRDRETAEIAINASLTGHLVFSTLHTNDAPTAITRLVDIGVKPFLTAAALRAVVAQRLVRRICARCRRSYTPSPRELHGLGVNEADCAGAQFAQGAGCSACHGTGYRGRLGLFEILVIDDGMRGMIYDRVTAHRLRQHARRGGMRTLREDGVRKVLAGLTTLEEVVAVTVADPL